jgi:hypothetical protein
MTSRLLAQVHNVDVSVRQSFCDSRKEREVNPSSLRADWRPLHKTKAWNCNCKSFLPNHAKTPFSKRRCILSFRNYIPEVRHKELLKTTHILPASAAILVWELSKWNPFATLLTNIDGSRGFIWATLTRICQQPIYLQVKYLVTHLAACLCLPTHPSIYLSIYLCLSIYLSTYVSIDPSIHPTSIYVHMNMSLSMYPSGGTR